MSGYGDRYRDPLDEAFGDEPEAPREVASNLVGASRLISPV